MTAAGMRQQLLTALWANRMLPSDGHPKMDHFPSSPTRGAAGHEANDSRRMVVNRSRFVPTVFVASVVVLSGCAMGGSKGEADNGDDTAIRETVNTRDAELYLTQAELSGPVDRFHQALQAAMAEVADDPENALGHYQAGRAQIGLQNFAAADRLFKRALELHPEYQAEVNFYREKGWISAFNASIGFQDLDSLEAVVEVLQDAEMIFPGRRPEAIINLAATYSTLGRIEESIEAFGAALEIIRGPRTREMMIRDSSMAKGWLEHEEGLAFNRAALMSNMGRYDEAADEYAALFARHPDNISALSNMAAALSAAGMPDSAQAIYDNLLEGEDLAIRDYFNIGVGLYTADEFTRAAQAFQAVVDVSPQNREALLNLTLSLHGAEEFETCVPVARDLVDLDQYNQDNYNMLARCLVGIEEDLEAGRVIEAGQALPFTIGDPKLEPRSGGGGTVTANLKNNALEPGAMITIRVHFNGEDGGTVDIANLRLEAPAQGETVSFEASITSDEAVMGFYFQIIPPRF